MKEKRWARLWCAIRCEHWFMGEFGCRHSITFRNRYTESVHCTTKISKATNNRKYIWRIIEWHPLIVLCSPFVCISFVYFELLIAIQILYYSTQNNDKIYSNFQIEDLYWSYFLLWCCSTTLFRFSAGHSSKLFTLAFYGTNSNSKDKNNFFFLSDKIENFHSNR